MESAKDVLFGKKPIRPTTPVHSDRYLRDIFGYGKAKDMVLNGPSRAAEEYVTQNVINPTLHDPSRPSVVIIDGGEVNLRTYKNSASKNRKNNNGLTDMEDTICIESMESSSSNSTTNSSVQIVPTVTHAKSFTQSSDRIKRMKRRSAKYMHGQKRPSCMKEEQKEECSAAIRVDKLYSNILVEGKAEEHVETISNALGEEGELFDSQKYNDCFMNIYGYSE